MKKLSILCVMMLLVATSVSAEIKNPDTFIKATYGSLRTLDPAVCYDTTGDQRLSQIYESLIMFKGESTANLSRFSRRKFRPSPMAGFQPMG